MEYNKLHDIAIQFGKTLIKKDSDLKEWVEDMLPELKESEDEKIRKAILWCITTVELELGCKDVYGIAVGELKSWLEKQGEQKPADKIEPKFKVGDIIRHKERGFTCKIIAVDTEYRLSECNGTHLPFDWQDAYELAEQTPAWSVEDESLCTEIQGMLGVCRIKELLSSNLYEKMCNWLKFLKDRVFSQPKQEWSEEDEVMIDEIIDFFENGTVRLQHDLSFYASFLKSLKDRYTWKPSEEQIEALESATENCAYSEYQDCLKELIVELKKLREE